MIWCSRINLHSIYNNFKVPDASGEFSAQAVLRTQNIVEWRAFIVQDTINIAAVDDLPADLERLMDRLLRRLRLEEYIDLSATAASVRVLADEVLYAEVLNHRMRLLTRAGEFLLRMTVEELKPMLPKDGRFYECHRGIVINLDAVGTLEAQVVVMENGDRLPVSRRRRPSLEQAYAERSIARVRSEL